MDNLINRWRTTVDNHNKKLQNIREQSQEKNVLRESTQSISNLQQKSIRANSQMKGGEKSNMNSISNKISKLNNDVEVLSQRSGDQNNYISSIRAKLDVDSNDDEEEDQNEQTILEPAIIQQTMAEKKAPPRIEPQIVADNNPSVNPNIKHFVDNIVSTVYPEAKLKTKKSREVQELAERNISVGQQITAISRHQKHILNKEYDLKMLQKENEDISKQLSEIERKLQKTTSERQKYEQQTQELEQQIQGTKNQQSSTQTYSETFKEALEMMKQQQIQMESTNEDLKIRIQDRQNEFREKERMVAQEFEEIKMLILELQQNQQQ